MMCGASTISCSAMNEGKKKETITIAKVYKILNDNQFGSHNKWKEKQ